MQNYIDNSGDIQTAALIFSYSSLNSKKENELVSKWVEWYLFYLINFISYRDLLDKWELYTERAKFDISRNKAIKDGSTSFLNHHQPQLSLKWNYCSVEISNYSNQKNKNNSESRPIFANQNSFRVKYLIQSFVAVQIVENLYRNVLFVCLI